MAGESGMSVADRDFRRVLIRPTGPALEILCRYAPAAERQRIWEAANGPVPEGMRVGCTCDVAYCGKLRHMRLVEDRTRTWTDWRAYAKKLLALKDGRHFDIEAAEMNCAPLQFAARLRAALGSGKAFLIRRSVCTMPEGKVRVTRIGRLIKESHRRARARKRC